MAGYVVCPKCGAGIGQVRVGESERIRCECCGTSYVGKGYCFGSEYSARSTKTMRGKKRTKMLRR